MIIDRKIKKYLVFDEDPIIRALEKMDANNMRVVFIVNESGTLEGIVTDGDVRRWLIKKQRSPDLLVPIASIANTDFRYCRFGEAPEKISSFFSSRIEYVPLVDDKMHLLAVAGRRRPSLLIGDCFLSDEDPAFVIAEIGNNHNGSLELAKKLVDEAVLAGANCVKFQMRNMKKLYKNEGDSNDAGEDLGSQYVLDLLDKFQLSDAELVEVFDHCKIKGTIPLCTPWDLESVDFLDNYGIEAFKVASADFTNHDLLRAIADKGKIMICSTGMCNEQEIKAGVTLLKQLGAQFVLLHCNSTYPSPFKDINLNYLERLSDLSGFPVGYSGHERGIHIAVAAVSMGAKVIEKHFTLDRGMEGNDHKVSLLPEEFKTMVRGIREVEQALGTNKKRQLSQGELINRESLGKSLIINQDLREKEVIRADMIEIKSPGKGLPPYRKKDLIGLPAPRNFSKGDFFYPEDLEKEIVQPRLFQFCHPFGVPVRYHDAVSISKTCPMDLLEIHLSYKDLGENIGQFFSDPFENQLVVHSPELFEGDHVLDLCTDAAAYRSRSIRELQRVVDITNQLKQYFPKSAKPPIVLNVGGFSADNFIPVAERARKYELLLDSLGKIDQAGVEIIPQTMPPFPWHFGGQRFHNLFVDSAEIVDFCTKNNYRVCLDISHSKLACNYTKYSFVQFIEEMAPVTAHLHIADAKGIDGEGLQIETGEIDFKLIMAKLKECMPTVSFIPEIWQGHKNNGQGFWVALDKLEGSLA